MKHPENEGKHVENIGKHVENKRQLVENKHGASKIIDTFGTYQTTSNLLRVLKSF